MKKEASVTVLLDTLVTLVQIVHIAISHQEVNVLTAIVMSLDHWILHAIQVVNVIALVDTLA